MGRDRRRGWAEIGAGALADVRLDLQVVLHATEDDRFREQCLRLVELQEEQLAAVLTDRVVPGTGRSTSDAEAARLARALRSLALGFAVRAVLGGAGTEAEFPAACVALVALVDPS